MRLPCATLAVALLLAAPHVALAQSDAEPSELDVVGTSPYGPEDEIGALNAMTDASRLAVVSRIASGQVYDLSVEYFVGMPSYDFNGQPRFQIFNVHTPKGTVVDDTTGQGDAVNQHLTYSGSMFSMYAHTGTHVDALAHFGLGGTVYNGFTAEEHLGDRGWRRAGVENYPPMIARGVLIDVAAFKEMEMLPPSYGITVEDIDGTLAAQGMSIEEGDVVMVRTGRMALFEEDRDAYMADTPGLTRESANHLADLGAILVGADNISTDVGPSEEDFNYLPVHSSMLTGRGVPIMQNVYLEGLAEDDVHEFAWFGAPLKLRGSDGGPMRPFVMPLRAG
jgi:kynurenine formamidase